MDLLEFRFLVYRHFAETGGAPSRHELVGVVGDIDVVDGLLRQLHDR